MINIKDKLARTNILIQRTQDAVAEYVTEDVFYDKISEINKELSELEDGVLKSFNTGVSEGIRQQKDKLETISITKNGEYVKEDGYNKISVNVAVEGNYDEGYEDGIAEGMQQQKEKLESITISENGEYLKEDGYNKVIVNVEGTSPINFREIRYDTADADNIFGKMNADIAYSKMRMEESESFFPENQSKLKEFFKDDKDIVFCPFIVTENLTDMSNFFANCEKMIYVPLLDTNNVHTMINTFGSCSSIQKLPNFDTGNVITMRALFANCQMLKEIPNFNTSLVQDVGSMFSNCPRLEKIPLLDFGKVYKIDSFFGYANYDRLTDLGGFKNLKVDWNDNTGLVRCPKLTHESLMNVITNLYNFRENGDNDTVKTLKISSSSMALLSDDDKALATNKGWTLIS